MQATIAPYSRKSHKPYRTLIHSLEGGSSHSERCGKFFGAVADHIQQLQQGGTLTAQEVAGFRQAIAYGDRHPMPGIDLTKLDLKVGTNPFLRRCDHDDDGRVRDQRDGDDGYRCGGNDHDADDRGIDWNHPRPDPDRLEDDRERLGKDGNRLNRDYDRCEDDLERVGDDLEDSNWKALASDVNRYAQDLQHYSRDVQRYDRDLQRYERDRSSEIPAWCREAASPAPDEGRFLKHSIASGESVGFE